MRYYIPTTILNLGNILSSDSISPESFYKHRGFGNSYWYSVEENNIPNVVLLYKQPFRFSRPKSEIEDCPVLISIESSEEFTLVSEDVVACDHTIYFDWNTEFIFFSPEDKLSALSLLNIGISTKMTFLYKEKRMRVEENLPFKNYCHNVDLTGFDLNRYALSSEYITNKLRGLLYGYYIGALLTTTQANVVRLSTLKDVYDSLTSELSSYVGRLQNEEVLEVTRIVKQWIVNEIGNTEKTINDTHHALPVNSNEIVIENGKAIQISNRIINQERENKLFLNWINNIIIKDKWGSHINSIKSALADELTDEAIKVYGTDKWRTSRTRAFLNDLRHHLAGETFHQEWNNSLLSSLAAFLINGDDWEKMLLFMQKKGMYDYRIVFAIWGTFIGFADMPRTFTDIIFSQPKPYVKDFYDEVFRQIHGVTIEIKQTESDRRQKSLESIVRQIWELMPLDLKKKKVERVLLNGINVSLKGANYDSKSFLFSLKKQDKWSKDSGIENQRWSYFQEQLNSMFLDE